ncbi:MAG TPA: hypothetical protein VE733_22070 [Streptosporangiaceae bacterium]|jgi:RNA polymerase sigma-70 factor (ECF subfamily)|nr:hypothetical protein [Streptosporangiaceae bacterium]
MVAMGQAMGAAVADAHRHEWAFVLAATVRVTRHVNLPMSASRTLLA